MKEDEQVTEDEEEDDDKEADDQIFFTDYYPGSDQIYKDFDNLNDTLRYLNLMLVCTHNCNDSDFKIGRLITDTNCMESEFQNIKSFFPEDNIKLFGGMIGDFEIRFN